MEDNAEQKELEVGQPPEEKTYTIQGKTFTEEEMARFIALATQSRLTPGNQVFDKPCLPGRMKLATCWVKLNQLGTNVPLKDVTPAEAMLLAADHHRSAGGMPIFDIRVTGEVQRSPREEVDRLKMIYPVDKVMKLYPGGMPSLPVTFQEAVSSGLEANVETGKLIVQVGG